MFHAKSKQQFKYSTEDIPKVSLESSEKLIVKHLRWSPFYVKQIKLNLWLFWTQNQYDLQNY